MSRPRHANLRPLGAMRAAALGLPAARARELELARAWLDVAGEAIARRAQPAKLGRGGVLEIVVADERWRHTLTELLPGLVGRLARRHPALGIRRLRVREQPQAGGTGAQRDEQPIAPRASAPPAPEPGTGGGLAERLRTAMERYLDAAKAPHKA